MAYAADCSGRTDSFQRVRPSYQVEEIITFGVIPAILTIYFITIAIGAQCGAEWVLHYAKLYTALAGSIGFMLVKYEIGIGKQHRFRCFPFVIVTINILIAVCSTVLRLVQASMLILRL